MTAVDGSVWTEVCRWDDLTPDRGVAALVHGEQVALFRLGDGSVHAVGNRDPFSGANVMARGMVGSRGGVAVVFAPMFKQAFDLRTGRCLDDEDVSVRWYPVRIEEATGTVSIGTGEAEGAASGS